MTVQLPEDLDSFVRSEVASGHFPSEQEVMAEAVRLLRDRRANPAEAIPPVATVAATPHKPIWQIAAELRESIPAEEWDKLPADGAEQHDHSIYGTPKRAR